MATRRRPSNTTADTRYCVLITRPIPAFGCIPFPPIKHSGTTTELYDILGRLFRMAARRGYQGKHTRTECTTSIGSFVRSLRLVFLFLYNGENPYLVSYWKEKKKENN